MALQCWIDENFSNREYVYIFQSLKSLLLKLFRLLHKLVRKIWVQAIKRTKPGERHFYARKADSFMAAAFQGLVFWHLALYIALQAQLCKKPINQGAAWHWIFRAAWPL